MPDIQEMKRMGIMGKIPFPKEMEEELAWPEFKYNSEGTTTKEIETGSRTGISQMWEYTPGGNITSSTVIGDINKDGVYEIVFGAQDSDDNPYLWVVDAEGNFLWNYSVGGDVKSTPAIGDIDGDEEYEIVFGSEDNNIYALDAEGNLLWSYTTPDEVEAPPLLYDIDGDGAKEVLIGSQYSSLTDTSKSHSFVVLDGSDGSVIDSLSIEYYYTTSKAAVLDDVIYVAFRGGWYSYLYIRSYTFSDGSLNLKWAWGQNETHCANSIAVGDIDNDGNKEVDFGSGTIEEGADYEVARPHHYAVEGGALEWDYDQGSEEYWMKDQLWGSPALADVDGDGYLETINYCRDGNVYCLDHNGNEQWTYKTGLVDSATSEVWLSSPAVVDIDGDGQLEVIIGVAGGTNLVIALNHDGSLLWEHSTSTDDNTSFSPAIADLDLDGIHEIVIAQGKMGRNKNVVSESDSGVLRALKPT